VWMYSQHPFEGREDSAVPEDSVEREALQRLIAGEKEYVYSGNERFLYARPITMSNESCVSCHNNHPKSTFRNWKRGDVRSALVAEINIPPSQFDFCSAIMMLDVDHFKRVNDKYGHAIGDECLQCIASCIKKALQRDKDIIARSGGEEFPKN